MVVDDMPRWNDLARAEEEVRIAPTIDVVVKSGRLNSTVLGLDIGTSRICLAQKAGDKFQYNTQLNAFVTIPFSNMTESMLKKAQIPHELNGSNIVVYGTESGTFADMLNVDTRRTMDLGLLNANEPNSLDVIRQILSSMVEDGSSHKICFTVPAAPLGSQQGISYHQQTLTNLLTELGHDVFSVNEGLAVVYAELAESNFTGIGISCGGGLCNVCLAHLSMPALSFSINKGGDYIDNSAASLTGERPNRIRLIKEQSFDLNTQYSDKTCQVIGLYYDEVILSLVKGMKAAILEAGVRPKLNRPIPLVLSGGTASPLGFRDRFEKVLMKEDFPIALSCIRIAKDPLQTAAKGALVAALSEPSSR
ncbi:MAG: hypothetical protein ACR2NN_05235 [Bryobacteraceae bacterium]